MKSENESDRYLAEGGSGKRNSKFLSGDRYKLASSAQGGGQCGRSTVREGGREGELEMKLGRKAKVRSCKILQANVRRVIFP